MLTLKEIVQQESDIRHVRALRSEIKRMNLSRQPAFDNMSDYELAKIYNGYGPDSWPVAIRDAVTWCYDNWEVLALIHDLDFHLSDGTRRGWMEATARWQINGSLALSDRYPMRKFWLWPARMIAWAKLRASLRALQLCSWPAWVSACGRRGADVQCGRTGDEAVKV